MAKIKDQDYEMWAREIARGSAVVFFGLAFQLALQGLMANCPWAIS
ncbi:hypothetical protein MM0346_05450 [Helicobacter pylori]